MDRVILIDLLRLFHSSNISVVIAIAIVSVVEIVLRPSVNQLRRKSGFHVRSRAFF